MEAKHMIKDGNQDFKYELLIKMIVEAMTYDAWERKPKVEITSNQLKFMKFIDPRIAEGMQKIEKERIEEQEEK